MEFFSSMADAWAGRDKTAEPTPAKPAVPDIGIIKRILTSRTHFEVFDIPAVAVDGAIITKLYRRLALKVHPDKCRHADGPAAFRRLSEANEVLSDASGQRSYLFNLSGLARAAAASRDSEERHQYETAKARKAAAEAAAQEAREAEERALRRAAKEDKKRERELRRQQAAAAAARQAAQRKANEEADIRAKEEAEAAARDETRRRAEGLRKARRRLRNTRAALQADVDEAAAAGEGTGSTSDDVAPGEASTGCLLTETQVEFLCARLSEAELERVLVALLVGDQAAVAATAAEAAAKAAAEAAEAAATTAARRAAEAAAAAARAEALQWSEEEQTALVKAAKTQGLSFVKVGGHANWETVAGYIHTRAANNTHTRDAASCRAEFRRLANEHRKREELKKEAKASEKHVGQGATLSERLRAAEEKVKKKAAREVTKATENSESSASQTKTPAVVLTEAGKSTADWTTAEQKALETALKKYPASDKERWDKIAADVGKTRKQVIKRCKQIREQVMGGNSAPVSAEVKAPEADPTRAVAEWTVDEQHALEAALKKYPASDKERWDKTAAEVGKTKKQVINRCKQIRDQINK